MLAFAMLSILATPVSCGKLRSFLAHCIYADLDWPFQTPDFSTVVPTCQPFAADVGGTTSWTSGGNYSVNAPRIDLN